MLIDTSAFVAAIDTNDDNHRVASAILSRLTSARWPLFTTNFVIAETHALLLRRIGWRAAAAFVETSYRSAFEVVRVSERDEERAREIILRWDDKTFSYTDASSFAVMERTNVAQAFTFDRDFVQYGFVTLSEGIIR